MFEFIEADIASRQQNSTERILYDNNALVQEQANISSIIQSHSQTYYTSRKLTEILFKKDSEYLEYRI
ncbi:unnamed protein product [Rhizophagus irregularis]|nr:unnamed protein product [Rhizophagus irregularis]